MNAISARTTAKAVHALVFFVDLLSDCGWNPGQIAHGR